LSRPPSSPHLAFRPLYCYTSSMYLAETFDWKKDGTKRVYYVLRESRWDPKGKRPKHRYLAYVGTQRTITESRAKELARKISEKLGRPVTVEDLRKVRRLKIMPDPERPATPTDSELVRRARERLGVSSDKEGYQAVYEALKGLVPSLSSAGWQAVEQGVTKLGLEKRARLIEWLEG